MDRFLEGLPDSMQNEIVSYCTLAELSALDVAVCNHRLRPSLHSLFCSLRVPNHLRLHNRHGDMDPLLWKWVSQRQMEIVDGLRLSNPAYFAKGFFERYPLRLDRCQAVNVSGMTTGDNPKNVPIALLRGIFGALRLPLTSLTIHGFDLLGTCLAELILAHESTLATLTELVLYHCPNRLRCSLKALNKVFEVGYALASVTTSLQDVSFMSTNRTDRFVDDLAMDALLANNRIESLYLNDIVYLDSSTLFARLLEHVPTLLSLELDGCREIGYDIPEVSAFLQTHPSLTNFSAAHCGRVDEVHYVISMAPGGNLLVNDETDYTIDDAAFVHDDDDDDIMMGESADEMHESDEETM